MKATDFKNIVYLKLLNIFTHGRRSELSTPFNVGNRTVASNGWALISVPKQEGFEDESKITEGVYPLDFIMDKKILVSELKEKLDKFPKIDCFDEEEKECEACYGIGEVDFYFSHNGEDYEQQDYCPVCEGDGVIEKISKVPNGKKEFDYNKFFGVGNSIFNVARIEELLEVAETIKCDEIILVNQTQQNRASLFKMKEVEVLLMPTMCTDESLIVQKL